MNTHAREVIDRVRRQIATADKASQPVPPELRRPPPQYDPKDERGLADMRRERNEGLVAALQEMPPPPFSDPREDEMALALLRRERVEAACAAMKAMAEAPPPPLPPEQPYRPLPPLALLRIATVMSGTRYVYRGPTMPAVDRWAPPTMRDESGAVVPLAVRGGTAMHAFNPSNGEHMGPASNFTAEQRAVLVLVPENYAHPIEGQLRRVRWSGDGRPVLWLSPEQLADEAEAEQ